jgi:hypothetical protein
MHFHIAADIISNLLRWSVFGKGRCRRTHTASVTSYHVNRRTQTAYVNRRAQTAYVNRGTHTAAVTSNHVNRRTHTASVTSNHEPEELILHL